MLIFFNCLVSSLSGQGKEPSERLSLTDEELSQYKCSIVASYFQYKKHVQVVSSSAVPPRVRNANAIALYRLLDNRFTTTDFKAGNREEFISRLKSKTNDGTLLKKKYTVFDCPNFNFIDQVTPDFDEVNAELELMDIVDRDIKTKKYKGWMVFAEEEYGAYNIDKGMLNPEGTGLTKEATVKKLRYQIYPIDSISVVLKIDKIETVRKVETLVDSTTRKVVYEKVNPKDFVICCDQPTPNDKDSDGYNELVDCNDNDASIYPGAIDIVGDGIDQDCDGEDQQSEDKDGDGYFTSACYSDNPEIRKLCDCYDDNPDVYFRDSSVSESEWYDPTNGWNDDNCDCIKDRIQEVPWVELKKIDFLVPGIGHLKKGPKNASLRKGFATVYGVGFIAGASYAVYSKIQASKFYQMHKESETFRSADIHLGDANRHNKQFLIASGATLVLFAANATQLILFDNNQKKLRNETFKEQLEQEIHSDICNEATLGLGMNSGGIGLSLNVKL